MAVWSGNIGFAIMGNDGHDVYAETIVERHYTGKSIRLSNRYSNSSEVNDTLVPNGRISFIGDSFCSGNISRIKYVRCWGNVWTVNSFDLEGPSIILSLGGVYNGNTCRVTN